MNGRRALRAPTRCPLAGPCNTPGPWNSLALHRAVAYVLAVLHAVEADALDRLVGAGGCAAHRVAEGGDAQHAPAVGHRGLSFELRAGVEDAAVLGRLGQPLDGIALARLFRVAVRGDHYAKGRASIPLGF